MPKEEPAPATPPNGTYNCGPDSGTSTWSGSFTYTDGAIQYTGGPSGPYSATNQSSGDAIVFTIGTAPNSAHFNLATPGTVNGKAQYQGTMNTPGQLRGGSGGWTATQT